MLRGTPRALPKYAIGPEMAQNLLKGVALCARSIGQFGRSRTFEWFHQSQDRQGARRHRAVAACCARAASGQAATAPPRSVMNSRR